MRGISEVARRALAGLVRLRLLRAVGRARATRYVPLPVWRSLTRARADWLRARV
jgi:hypothetical protein